MKKMDIASSSTVAYYLVKLEAMGLIRRDANISRGIVVCGMERQAAMQNPKNGYYRSAVYKMPKGKTLEDRIEMVVARAKELEEKGLLVDGVSAIHNRLHLFPNGRMRGSKV